MPAQIGIVQKLWSEYWESMGLAPDFQDFAEERDGLPGKYAPPGGRLLLATVDGAPAGTAAFRTLDAKRCEAKRLYVRPEFRGAGLGRTLLARLVDEARAAGYTEMYGDTLTSMESALRLYDQFGFTRVEAYAENPTPGAIFLRLSL